MHGAVWSQQELRDVSRGAWDAGAVTEERHQVILTLRAPILGFYWVGSVLLSVPSIAALVDSNDLRDPHVWPILILVIPAAWAALRLPFMRVSVTPDALTNHGLLRNRCVTWSDVESVQVRGSRWAPTGGSFAPCLILRRRGRLELTLLAVISPMGEPAAQSRLGHQRDLLEGYLEASVAARRPN